jgi:ADP-ribose pyrophosphatase YjhB (NUDIX family)
MTDTADWPERPDAWLDEATLAEVRRLIPIVYIDAVPVQVDDSGDVIAVGLLLRMVNGTMTHALVSGRVLYHERVRDALLRHIEKDLGPVALPQVPPSPQPFTVAEYIPTPGVTPYHDPRQHAISLAYVVPVLGDCEPQQDAIDLAWMTPEEACGEPVRAAMAGGQGYLLQQAMAHVGRLA